MEQGQLPCSIFITKEIKRKSCTEGNSKTCLPARSVRDVYDLREKLETLAIGEDVLPTALAAGGYEGLLFFLGADGIRRGCLHVPLLLWKLMTDSGEYFFEKSLGICYHRSQKSSLGFPEIFQVSLQAQPEAEEMMVLTISQCMEKLIVFSNGNVISPSRHAFNPLEDNNPE